MWVIPLGAYACTAEPKTATMERNSPRDKRGVVGIPRAHGGGWGGVPRVIVGLWHTEQCGIECEIERRSGATAGRAASEQADTCVEYCVCRPAVVVLARFVFFCWALF